MTKKQAIKELRTRREKGEPVKLYRRSGVYTQPGRGIVAFVSYEVR